MLAVVLELTAFSTNLVGRFRISDVWKKRFAPHPRTQPQTGRKKARVCENLNTLRRGPPPRIHPAGVRGRSPRETVADICDGRAHTRLYNRLCPKLVASSCKRLNYVTPVCHIHQFFIQQGEA